MIEISYVTRSPNYIGSELDFYKIVSKAAEILANGIEE